MKKTKIYHKTYFCPCKIKIKILIVTIDSEIAVYDNAPNSNLKQTGAAVGKWGFLKDAKLT